MKSRLSICALLFLIPYLAWGHDGIRKAIGEQEVILRSDPQNREALRKIGMLMLNKADYDQAITYGKKLLEIAGAENDIPYLMHAHICLGQAYVMWGNQAEAHSHLNRALAIATDKEDHNALCSVYNGLGLYSANIERDYYRSIDYFMKGIEIALQCDNQYMHSLILCNISGIYYLKRDPEGLKYAEECYKLGHQRRDAYLIYCGAVNLAYLHYLLGNYETALNYVKEGEFQAINNDYYDITSVYSIYASVWMELGNEKKAEELFGKALDMSETGQTSSIMSAYIGYAKLLSRRNEHGRAITLLKKAQELSYADNNPIYLAEVLENIAGCYEAQGNYRQAVEYYRLFQVESVIQFNADKERNVNDLLVKYDTERAENKLRQSEVMLLKKEKKLQQAAAIVACFAIAAGLLFYLYRRKNALYLAIVTQNQDAILREKRLQKRLDGYEGKYVASSLTDEKSAGILNRLDKLMGEEKMYANNLLTKEQVAKTLATNRTYLSRIINEQTGRTFTQYINAFRIEEAIRILSDENNDTPLKAIYSNVGFSSRTTFHNLFKESVGMSPAQYRQTVRQLHHKKT